MNVTELLAGLQAQHDETAARASELRNQIAHLTAALAETEARLGTWPPPGRSSPNSHQLEATPIRPRRTPPYQAIVNTFNQHPDQVFRARDLHELLSMPTNEASVNITRSRLGRLTRQGFLTQPGRGRYQKRT